MCAIELYISLLLKKERSHMNPSQSQFQKKTSEAEIDTIVSSPSSSSSNLSPVITPNTQHFQFTNGHDKLF